MKIPLSLPGTVPAVSLPPDAITQTFAILAVRGAGKSNLAAVMAEGMAAAALPFVVIDPVGSWYGLRSGLPIPIFGGKRGDVPLEKTGGALVADLVVSKRMTAIIDVSEMSEGDKTRFLIDFAETLYRKNTEPLHLFLEEADDFCPQRPFREQARLVRAWENVVRRGRGRGLGMTMITQRSAALNKNVLTQVETLFVLRTTSPQDRKAIAGWVEYHGQSEEVLASLAGLKTGEAWVWSPQYLKTMERFYVARRATFDSGATPNGGKSKKAGTLADVDLGAVKAAMAATIERAKQDDPKELRAEIARLKKVASGHVVSVSLKPPKRVEIPVLTAAHVALLEKIGGKVEDLSAKLAALRTAVVPRASSGWSNPDYKGTPAIEMAAMRSAMRDPGPATLKRLEAARKARGGPEDGILNPTQGRILDTIQHLNDRRIEPTRISVARWMGIHPNGGRYITDLARLREGGYLDGMRLSPKGECSIGAPLPYESSPVGALRTLERIDMTRANVFRKILELSRPVTRGELAAELGIHPNGGRYITNLARLREMGLITETGPIQATEGALR